MESIYQAQRIQKICDEVGIWCFNPLWKVDQEDLLNEVIARGFNAVVSGVFAYPLPKEFLVSKINESLLSELITFRDSFKISPSGEGGEIETTVLDAPFFKKRIIINDFALEWDGTSGSFVVKNARLEKK